MTKVTVNKEAIQTVANDLVKLHRIMQMQNDLINFVPKQDGMSESDLYLKYHAVYKALDNIYELNSGLISDLDQHIIALDEQVESSEEDAENEDVT